MLMHPCAAGADKAGVEHFDDQPVCGRRCDAHYLGSTKDGNPPRQIINVRLDFG
jgi:hypothetical protein